MFFRRERDMIVPGLVGGAVGALAAGYIVSRDGRKIPVDKNGNPVQGQAQGQAQAQGGEQQAANQNQKQQAQANKQGQQGATAGGNTQAEKPQAQATTQQPVATQNNTTTQKPPAQNTQPKPTTTTQPAGNTSTTTSQTTTPPKPTTTTTSTGGNTTITQKPANNTTKTQPSAPKTTPQNTPTTQNKNTQGQFKRPENFDRNAARQQKWQANRDRKDAGIARRNALKSQQKPAGNASTGGFVRNTAGDKDTRRYIAMENGASPRATTLQGGKISPNGMRYAPGQTKPAAPTVNNTSTQTAANAAKQTGQHIRDRRAADPLKDRIVKSKARYQAELRKNRLRTEAYKTDATSALGRAGDRTTTFFKRRGQDIKTGVKTVGSGIKSGASAVGSGFKRATNTFRKGGRVNGFIRSTGTAIKTAPVRAGAGIFGGMSKGLGKMSSGLSKLANRSGATSRFLRSSIKK